MPFWLPGGSSCARCGQVLREGDNVFQLPPAWLPAWECHRALQNQPPMGASKPAGIQAFINASIRPWRSVNRY